jgi:hypothetical protein
MSFVVSSSAPPSIGLIETRVVAWLLQFENFARSGQVLERSEDSRREVDVLFRPLVGRYTEYGIWKCSSTNEKRPW